MVDGKPKKKFKKKASGRKAKKKEDKGGKKERHNPKAFTYSGGKNAIQKKVQYIADKRSKAVRAERIDKTPAVPPPIVVVVQGPPGSGKTTLIRSLVKLYTKHNLNKCEGPITLVSGKQRRLTFIECSNDVRQMVDLAKIADLVLLTVDASYGFEMETFEFLNILQVHGFPRVIGILTHLDKFPDNKSLRAVKRKMKHRFWTEIYDGAKLFNLSGIQYGRYNKTEIFNLSRFIAVAKFHPTTWRAAHPHMLAQRWEDVTPGHIAKHEPRTVNFYGYLSGARLHEGMQVHIPGVGDFPLNSITEYDDPCPCPEAIEKSRTNLEHSIKGRQKNAPLRTLKDKHKLLYAPACNAGNVLLDADAMYINLPEYKTSFTKEEHRLKNEYSDEDSDAGSGSDAEEEKIDSGNLSEAVTLVRELQDATNKLQDVVGGKELQIVKGGQAMENVEPAVERKRRPVSEGMFFQGELQEKLIFDEGSDEEGNQLQNMKHDADIADGEEGSEEDEDVEMEEGPEIDQERIDAAKQKFAASSSLNSLVYSHANIAPKPKKEKSESKKLSLFDDDEEEEEEEEEITPMPASGSNQKPFGQYPKETKDDIETSKLRLLTNVDPAELFSYDDKHGWILVPTKEEVREHYDMEKIDDIKRRFFITGGFDNEDTLESKMKAVADSDNESTAEGDDTEKGWGSDEEKPEVDDDAENAPKPTTTKQKNSDLPQLEGSFGIATFVRIQIQGIPTECVDEFDPKRPIILGGLLPGEGQCGYVQLRVKKHRWAPRILKSNDPMLVSAGWRRYQTMPVYALEDRNKRVRMLKYTPEHMHCMATIYGPALPATSGVMFIRNWDAIASFRISATGLALEAANAFKMVKKLKLVGDPYKVFKNTAFIKGMFHSDLEVNKCQNAKIQTVSGLRGEIKKAIGSSGNFRAAFEDKILMSDLVLLKAWIEVEPKKFYNPMIDVAEWRKMKTFAELRRLHNVPAPFKKDSEYGKKPERKLRKFTKLQLPKSLQQALPFDSRNKVDASDVARKDRFSKETAVVRSKEERQASTLISKLLTVRAARREQRADNSKKKKVLKEKREAFIKKKRGETEKVLKKKQHIKKGQEEKRMRQKLRLED